MGMPFPGLWNTAQQQAQAQLGALIAAAEGANRRSTRQGKKFIRGLTRAYANELAAIGTGVGEVFDDAQGSNAAINASLGAYLRGSGQNLANQLGDQLGFATPEAQNQFVGGQTRVGNVGAGTGFALGSANLQRLVGEGASEEAFSRQLPGIAALSGIQNARGFVQSQGRDLSDQIAQINAQAPGLTADLYNSLAGLRMQQQGLNLERQRLGIEQGAAKESQFQERLDAAQSFAFQMIGEATQPDLTGKRNYNARDLLNRVSTFYSQQFPGRSDAWALEQARQSLASHGIQALDSATSGAVQSYLGGMFGNSLGAQRASGGGASGLGRGFTPGTARDGPGQKPRPDAIFYDQQPPGATNWEGPGWYVGVPRAGLIRVG